MKYKAFIVDDEQKAIDALKWKLSQVEQKIQIIGEFLNPEKALLKCISQKVDLIFLDIEMPEMTGLEFLMKLKNLHHIPEIIFISGHEDFVLDALRKEAFDYIYKPVDIEELKQALTRFQNEIESRGAKSKSVFSKIALPTTEKIIYLDREAIIFCESDSNYTIFHMDSGEKHIIAKTLGKVDMMLGEPFMRIHNSYIINIQKIVSYQRGTGGSVNLQNGGTIPVSKNRKDELMERLNV